MGRTQTYSQKLLAQTSPTTSVADSEELISACMISRSHRQVQDT